MSTAGIAEQVREARAQRRPLRFVAGCTWLNGGHPCTATVRAELAGLSGITRYEPGDFVLTARAGTPLHVIAEAAAQHGQWLTLDPVSDPAGTIGATVATASYGPLASAFGTGRDHVLGCEFVTGAGDIVRAGGQVVKNVAGFDLTRLVTGAWGTLGVITEVTLRMRARPEVEETLAIPLGDDAAIAMWRWLRASEFTPLAAELLSASLSHQLGLGGSPVALLRFGGNAALVRAAVTSASMLGEGATVGARVWDTWRQAFLSAANSFRVSALPTKARDHWASIDQAMTSAHGITSATLARGVVRCGTPAELSAAALRSLSDKGTIIGDTLSAPLWQAIARVRNTKDLEQRVRATFDPDGVMNPGIMGA